MALYRPSPPHRRTFQRDAEALKMAKLTQTFGDLRVVHFGVVLCDFAPLETGPDHEGVHGPFDVLLAGFAESLVHGTGHGLLVDGRHGTG